MNPMSMLAIYFLFWFLSLFLVLPFGVRTSEEAGLDLVRGQAESAPAHFNVWQTVRRTSVVAAIFFAVFYLNHHFEWITAQTFIGVFGPR